MVSAGKKEARSFILATRDSHLVLNRLRVAERKGRTVPARRLVLAPYVRRQQAEVLERAGAPMPCPSLDTRGTIRIRSGST